MQVPRVEALAPEALLAARSVARRLAEHGVRGWIVGGAVRDLALGLAPKDLDMASAATPSEIEQWFEISHGVGRAFGTVVLVQEGVDLQLTTFRKETGYSDRRRPDRVELGTSLEEDARRRDFTCNALYLDPLTGEVRDPVGGLVDLEAGRLRCVGVPDDRFREDGLRLLRMVRLAARFDLEIDPETREAARRSREALVGVSPERVLAELVDMLARAGSGRAVGTLTELGLLERAVPGWAGSGPGRELRRAVVAALPDPPGAALGLAALFGPDPRQAQPGPSRGVAHELLAGLRPPRKLSRRVFEISDLAGEVVSRSGAPTSAAPSRAGVIRLVRRDEWTEAAALARAWCVAAGLDRASLDRLEAARAALSEEELFPARLLEARELLELGVERGPLLGTLLVELEDAQLDERVRTPEDARAWLERRMREGGRPSSGERSSAGPS